MYNKPYSPSELQRFRDAPVQELYKRFISRRTHSILNINAATVGTELHDAASEAFAYLKQQKFSIGQSNPSQNQINEIIRHAETRAEEGLRLHTSRAMLPGLKNVIQKYGKEYLENPNLDLETEKELTGRVSGRYDIYGRPDLLLVDRAKRRAEIVDLKNILDQKRMDLFDKAPNTIQGKTYALLAKQIYETQGIKFDNIIFTHAVNGPAGDPNYRSTTYTQQQLTDEVAKEIESHIENAEKYKQIAYYNMSRAKSPLDGFRDVYRDILKTKGCTPGNCKYCPIRYTCELRFTHDINSKIKDLRGITGEIDSTKVNRIVDQIDETANNASLHDMLNRDRDKTFQEKLYDEESAITRSKYEKARRETLSKVNSGVNIDTTISDELAILRHSQETRKKFLRGRFQDNMEKDLFAVKERLPFSAIQKMHPDLAHPWISTELVRDIDHFSRDIVTDVADKFGFNTPKLINQVVEEAFKDKDFVENLYTDIVNNTSERLHTLNVKEASKKDIRAAAKDGMNILKKDTLVSITDKMNKQTIDTIMKYDAEAVRSKLPAGYDFENSNLDALYESAVEHDIASRDPEKYRKHISKKNTAFAIKERFQLSSPRYMMSSMTKALFLTHIAAYNTIFNMVKNKTEKAEDFLTREKESVDSGEHLSAYTTARRLLHSDFGSSTRLFTPVSRIFSRLASRGSEVIQNARKTNAWNNIVESSKGYNMAAAYHRNPKTFYYGGAAAAATFITLGVLPHTPTEIENRLISEQNKLKFKQEKETNSTDNSAFQEPQSDLRSQYKIHSAFGSPAALAKYSNEILKRIDLTEVSGYLKELTDHPLMRSISYYGRNIIETIRRGLSLDKAVKTGEDILEDVPGKIKRVGRHTGFLTNDMPRHNINLEKLKQTGEYRRNLLQKHATTVAGRKHKEEYIKNKAGSLYNELSSSNRIGSKTKSHMPIVPEYKRTPKEELISKYRNRPKTTNAVYYKNRKTQKIIEPGVIPVSGKPYPVSDIIQPTEQTSMSPIRYSSYNYNNKYIDFSKGEKLRKPVQHFIKTNRMSDIQLPKYNSEHLARDGIMVAELNRELLSGNWKKQRPYGKYYNPEGPNEGPVSRVIYK